MFDVRAVRVYDRPDLPGSYTVLVDRLWPRGISRNQIPQDCWLRELAPSTELRQWYHAQPERWDEFRQRYYHELDQQHQADCRKLAERACQQTVVLLYAATDTHHNNAEALKLYLERLECARRYDAGWTFHGSGPAVRDAVHQAGGMWSRQHRAWVLPGSAARERVQQLLARVD